ncbi:hypothetical protein [Desulfitobacterium sp. AusDCA]|uniref:hypothetical protein n=1 Tax=Desulfitobacterium sp. AusDCA TaxID=3240383 RepID=UPI003DA77380
MDKKYVQIFVGNQSAGCGCSCGTSCGASSTVIPFDELLKKYLITLDDIAYFDVYKVSEKQDNDQLINELNEVLAKNGEKLIVDESNLGYVLSQAGPIIVVNNKIISIRNTPDEKELYDAVIYGKKIPVQKGCC